jgi:hypothetical protein
MAIPGVVFGAFGGVAGAFLAVIDAREPELVASRFRCPGLWISLFLQAALAGMIIAAYQASGFKLNAILCVNVGAASPAIVRGFISRVPPVTPGPIS